MIFINKVRHAIIGLIIANMITHIILATQDKIPSLVVSILKLGGVFSVIYILIGTLVIYAHKEEGRMRHNFGDTFMRIG